MTLDNLDKLARMMANGFGEAKQELRNFKLEVNDRFNRVENQLEKIKVIRKAT